MRRICHLVDDTSPGGVTRFLDYMRSDPEAAALGRHQVISVRAGLSVPPRIDADVIVSHLVLSWRNLPFLIALRTRCGRRPLIHMEHSYSPAFEDLYVPSPGRFHTMLRLSLSVFDRVVTISTAQRDWLASIAPKALPKLVLVPPYLDLTRFLSLDIPTGDIRNLGAFGRFDDQKGFDVLIPAFRQADLPANMKLHVYGDGPRRAQLEALAEDDPRIVFHGFTDDPAAAMASVDAVVMPSRREPYGLVALEALAAGRALLVSDVDGLRDHARNGAITVKELTAKAWADAMEDLPHLTGDTSRRQARDFAVRAKGNFVSGWQRLLNGVTL